MGLSYRCPLVGLCERWAITVFFFQFYDSYEYLNKSINVEKTLIENGIVQSDFKEKSIKVVAEIPEFLRSNDRVSYRNMCPEVNLFDDLNAVSWARGLASISGEYDNLRSSANKFTNVSHLMKFFKTLKKNDKKSSMIVC